MNLRQGSYLLVICCVFSTLFFSCQSSGSDGDRANPPMEGFNEPGSDPEAIRVADEVMNAMGGRRNWDATRYIAWNFFGNRKLLWDKHTGNVRIESTQNDLKILVNVHDTTGRVFKDGAEITQPDSLSKYLSMGKSMWINDSYWLVMPYKLKDSGVTLKYLGEDTTQAGEVSDVLQLTFTNVGRTPQNMYKVYVDKDKDLVNQWAYYQRSDQDTANFVMPWKNYQQHGNIMLSGDRGVRQITDIMVLESVPAQAFTSFEPVELTNP
jgi:hypothetical protein